MDIIVNVVNQKMYIASTMECLVSGSQHFVKFKFNLSEEWDGLTTLAQFQQDGKAYNSYLDENNCVYLPAEIKAGDCKLMLYGSCDTIIGTTNYLALKIDENIFVYDAQTPDIPDEVYDQLVGRAELELKLSGKVDKVEGMGLSKNDFSDDYKLTLDEFPQTIESILEQVENSKCDVSNLSDGSAEGSLRSVDAQGEDENYKMGDFAVALGQGAMAIGESSFAEGVGTRAEGYGSHAEGMFTVAKGNNQHVQGVANIVDEEARYAHIVGNGNPGTYNSNAHTLDWDGNAWFSGDVYVGGTSQDDENATKLSSVATDISQVKEKLEQVEEMSVKRTALPDGPIDLNTFITSGWWYTTEQRIDITNTPKDLAELELIVTKDVLSITQILIACDGGYGICYRFSHNSGKNWTDWRKFATDADVSTATNLVNGPAEGSLRSVCSYSNSIDRYIGDWAVALGRGTSAGGQASHAEGFYSRADGDYSHAEGQYNIARSDSSHAEGSDTIANGFCQHVQGRFNIEDKSGRYAHIVGNGHQDYEGGPSNAHTLDWDGNAWFAGDVYVGGTSQDDENATKLSSVATDITQVKEKLDGIEEGANKTIVDSELSDTSTNPLQNKVVTEKINSANSTITSIYNRVKNQVSYLARTQTANTTLLKIGTFTGDGSGGRAIITLNGKKGWNYKNDGGLKVLTLSSNIPSDANGICTGATFYDFGGSNDAGSKILDSVQDVQILLVRPQDYAVRKVDVYIKFNSAYQYNSFFVNVDWASGTTWEVDVKAITTTDTDPTTNALSSFVVPKKQFASLEKVETKADTETGTCTLTAYSDTVFGTVSNEILLNWASDTLKYYTTGSTDADGTLTVQGTGNARIINAYTINATGTVGVEFAVSGTGAIKIEIKGGGTTYTSGNISLSTTTQKIQITHATSGIAVLDDMEINIYASGETSLTIENLLKMTEASTRTLTGNYELVGNQVTVSVFVDNLQNGGEITLYPLPFVPKIAKSGVCGAFSSSSYSAIYYDIDGGTTAMIYLNDAPQANKQLTFYYTV